MRQASGQPVGGRGSGGSKVQQQFALRKPHADNARYRASGLGFQTYNNETRLQVWEFSLARRGRSLEKQIEQDTAMADHLSFTATQADKLSREIPAILGAVRADIANGAGFPVDEATIRVRRRELQKAVHDRLSKMLPTEAAKVAAILAGEPDLLEAYIDEDGSRSILEAVRSSIIEKIARHVGADMHRAISGQYTEADFATVIEEIRSTLPALAELDTPLADTLEQECANQLSKKVPASRGILRTINRAREVLSYAGRIGDKPKLVHARVLMEIADLIDMKGYQLDKTHVPPAAPSP